MIESDLEPIGEVSTSGSNGVCSPEKRRRFVEVVSGLSGYCERLCVLPGEEGDLGLGEIEKWGNEPALASELRP